MNTTMNYGCPNYEDTSGINERTYTATPRSRYAAPLRLRRRIFGEQLSSDEDKYQAGHYDDEAIDDVQCEDDNDYIETEECDEEDDMLGRISSNLHSIYDTPAPSSSPNLTYMATAQAAPNATYYATAKRVPNETYSTPCAPMSETYSSFESSWEDSTFNAPDDSSWWTDGPFASQCATPDHVDEPSSPLLSVSDSYFQLGPLTSTLNKNLQTPPQFNMSRQRSPIGLRPQAVGNATFVNPCPQAAGNATFVTPAPQAAGNATFVTPGSQAPANATFATPCAPMSETYSSFESSWEDSTFNAPDDSSWWTDGPFASQCATPDHVDEPSSPLLSVSDSYFQLGPLTSTLNKNLQTPPQFNMSRQRSPIGLRPQAVGNATFVNPCPQAAGNATFVTTGPQAVGNATFVTPGPQAIGNATFVTPAPQAAGNATFVTPCPKEGSSRFVEPGSEEAANATFDTPCTPPTKTHSSIEIPWGGTFSETEDSSWWQQDGPYGTFQTSSSLPSLSASYYRVGPLTSTLNKNLHSPPQFKMSRKRSGIWDSSTDTSGGLSETFAQALKNVPLRLLRKRTRKCGCPLTDH